MCPTEGIKSAIKATRKETANSANAVSNQERDNSAVEGAQKLIAGEPMPATQKERRCAAEESAVISKARVAKSLPRNECVENVSG